MSNIKAFEVTHSYIYDPSCYLEYCEENDIQPTQVGFFEYTLPEINEDFPVSQHHPYTLVE